MLFVLLSHKAKASRLKLLLLNVTTRWLSERLAPLVSANYAIEPVSKLDTGFADLFIERSQWEAHIHCFRQCNQIRYELDNEIVLIVRVTSKQA